MAPMEPRVSDDALCQRAWHGGGARWRSSWGLVVLRHVWPLAPREQMGIGHVKGSSGDGRGWAANVRITCSFCHLHMSNSKIDVSYQSNVKTRDLCVPTMYFIFS
jgi:hypothetical protein